MIVGKKIDKYVEKINEKQVAKTLSNINTIVLMEYGNGL